MTECGVREPLPARLQEAVDSLDRTGLIYSVQMHHAKSLHWDLRLQHGDTMASWALPKSIPNAEKVNHLGIKVADHALSYADFHGNIPEGYGAGQVELTDIGKLEVLRWDDKYIKVRLDGQLYKGVWSLRNTKGKNWIMRMSKE